MIKKFGNIIAWMTGTGVVLFGMIYGGAKYIAWEQIKEDRSIKADSLMIHELRFVRTKVDSLSIDFNSTRTNITTLQGSYKVLDRSYVRMLEKYLKDKDEKDQYQQEKIQMLEGALKKNLN